MAYVLKASSCNPLNLSEDTFKSDIVVVRIIKLQNNLMKKYNKLTTTVLSGHTVSTDIYLVKFKKKQKKQKKKKKNSKRL